MIINAYCDGSALGGNGKDSTKTGIGVFYPDFQKLNLSEPCDIDKKRRTNIRAELIAIIRCIENIINNFEISNIVKIVIKTDSLFCIKAVREWSKNWRKNDWIKSDKKPVENQDLIKKLIILVEDSGIIVEFTHVKGHTKEPKEKTRDWIDWNGNNCSDRLAKEGAEKCINKNR